MSESLNTPVSYEEAEQCLRRWQEGGVFITPGGQQQAQMLYARAMHNRRSRA
jgi:hypothetical protein